MSKQLDRMAGELMRHLEVLTQRFLLPQKSATLSRSEIALLSYLAAHGPSTMGDLSSGVGLALSSTTGVVDALVERKLVARKRASDDRRQVVVASTKAGLRMYESFVADRAKLGVAMLEPLTPAERDRLLALFRKITAQE